MRVFAAIDARLHAGVIDPDLTGDRWPSGPDAKPRVPVVWGRGSGLGSNVRLAQYYDRLTEDSELECCTKAEGPLQSRSKPEIALDDEPLTIYPQPQPQPRPQRRRVLVKYGPQPARLD